jgi:hypothetical protein
MLKYLEAAIFSTIFPLLLDFIYDYSLDFSGSTRVIIFGTFVFSVLSLFSDNKKENKEEEEKNFKGYFDIKLTAEELISLKRILTEEMQNIYIREKSK